jgi:hypothetical protein
LPPVYRQLFLLHDVLGYEHWEIAEILRCSTGSSKSQLHKARKRLRCLLQGEQWTAEPASSPSPDAENSGRTDTVCNLAIPSESKWGARSAPYSSQRASTDALPTVLVCSTQRPGFLTGRIAGAGILAEPEISSALGLGKVCRCD